MTLAKWLESHGCYDCRPCVVTIGTRQYEAVEYKKDSTFDEGTRRAGERYTTEGLYVLADSLPPCYRRSPNVCFTREGDAREWYVSTYSGELSRTPAQLKHWESFRDCYRTTTDEEHAARYAPFGTHFQLQPWHVPTGERIDAHEESQYRRVPLGVEYEEEERGTTLPCCFIGCTRAADGLHERTWAFCGEHLALQTAGKGEG